MEKRKVIRVIIMGAAGRDFHNFNTYFRDNPYYDVVAFTATQIPNISGRKYPWQLAGKLYPKGILIYLETELNSLIKKLKVDYCYLSYSDLSYNYVMHKASEVIAAGSNFSLLGFHQTSLISNKQIISVCAVRTGAGKSSTTQKLSKFLKNKGLKVVVVRHPMPYGDLLKQTVQRFETYEDLKKHDCTIEEREEYEPHLNNGIIVWEFRAHIKPDGTVRDHGPGFRISKLHLSNLYSKQTIIFDGSKPSEEQR